MYYTKQFNRYYPTLESRYAVYLGVDNETIKESDGNALRVPVAYIAVHPEFNLDGRYLNDIAVLKLAWEVELNDNIQLACLPDPNKPIYPSASGGMSAYAMGWGTMSEGSRETSDVLQNVVLDVLDGPKSCPYNPKFVNWDVQICAGVLAGGKDTCQGKLTGINK